MKLEIYNLNDPNELKEFYDDCCQAILECPQGDITLFKGDMYSLYSYFYKSSTLWSYGYKSYLSQKAKNTFENIIINKRGYLYNISELSNLTNYKFRETYEKS